MVGLTGFDPTVFKEDQRGEWDAAAAGWNRWLAVIEGEEAGRAQTEKLLALAEIGPGDVVLDVATGYGEPGLTAARSVQPGGRMVCSDLAGEMLAFARQRAEEAGLDNVEFLEADAEQLPFEAETFDAIICRHGLQFLTDVAGALWSYRAFLRPGGRLAAIVWGPPSTVGFARAMEVIREELDLQPPHAGQPGIFALSDADALAALVARAGFADVETGTLPVVYETATAQDRTQLLRDTYPPMADLVDAQPPDVAERVWARITEAWAPFITSTGGTRTECQAIWVVGTR